MTFSKIFLRQFSSLWRLMLIALFFLAYGVLPQQVHALEAFPTPSISSTPPLVQGPSVEGLTQYSLSNGLKVIFFPDNSKSVITVNMTYLVGSHHENYGETGMAHLLEHLLFKGTPTHPSIPEAFNQRGIEFNGTTFLDRTNYYASAQASDENLKWLINMEADRMIHSYISQADLDTEMTVVRNEFEKGENSPINVLIKRLQGAAFHWHNYGKPPIGNRGDIENVRIENLRAFYRTYYQPDNAVLLIAGKFDPEKTLRWISDAFSAIAKPTRSLPPFWTKEPTQDGEREVIVRRQGDVQVVLAGYKVPSELHSDALPIMFAKNLLSNIPHGRLYHTLVKTGKATEVFSIDLTGKASGLMMIGAIVKKEEPIAPVQAILIDTIENFYRQPPTEEEVDRIRRVKANQYDNLVHNSGALAIMLSESIALGDWRLFFLGRDQTKKITAKQIQAAAQHYLKRDNRTIGVFLPEDSPQRAEIPAAPSVATVLKNYVPRKTVDQAETFDPSPANIDHRTKIMTMGGIKLALLPKKTRGQVVHVSMNLDWGNEKALFKQRTASNMAAEMLIRGTVSKSRAQLDDAFIHLKITGSSPYQFQTTRAYLPEALQLITDIFQHPRFDPDEFEHLRKERLVELEAVRNDPNIRTSEIMSQHFNHYPPGHWFSPMSIETKIAALQTVTLEGVKRFHQQFYGASHGQIAIVGDFNPDDVVPIIQKFAHWQSKTPWHSFFRTNTKVSVVHKIIHTPDKENGSYLARINLDMRNDNPDYPAMFVANHLLGGGTLKSRLADRIRHKEGLSYGVGSSLHVDARSHAAKLSIHAIAAPQNMDRVNQAVKEEIARVLKSGFTEKELSDAKSSILQHNHQARTEDIVLSDGWLSLLDMDRTYAWIQQLEDRIHSLTLAEVNTVFRQRIDPKNLSVVMAFDKTKVK